MKQFVLAGLTLTDRTTLIHQLGKGAAALDEAWSGHDGTSRVDLVIVDLEQFAGRTARIRAIGEKTGFAVVADPDADVLGADLVLRRPLTADTIVNVFNRAGGVVPSVGCAPAVPATVATTSRGVPPADMEAANDPAVPASRASFHTPRRERNCTDFGTLVQRGPLLIERPGLPRLVLDPAADAWHANAPLSRLEPYFLDPLKGAECRQIPRSRLDELRGAAPARPLAQLYWMGAMLRSNGCLASHLDPGGTYRVQRWMPIYGEYRKQYRIATMMLRPSRLHEIARRAEATMVEVFDVVNAYDAIGLLEWQPRQSRHAAAAAAAAAEKTVDRPRAPATAQGARRLLAAALLTR